MGYQKTRIEYEKYPKSAYIQKVLDESDRDENHEQAVRAFLIADASASGLDRDWEFVQKIPGFIEELIDSKGWERLFVAKGVVTTYYCCYTKEADRENFLNFVTASRPNGLGTTLESLDSLLALSPKVQKKFRELSGFKPSLESMAQGIIESCDQQEIKALIGLLQAKGN